MKVKLISPFNGVVGGISIWTSNILSYCNSQHKVQIELFDFSRNRTGQMINNKLKRMFLAAYDYFHLTRKAVKHAKRFNGDVVHLCSSASYLLIRDYIVLRSIKRKHKTKTCIHFHFGRIPDLASHRNWEWKLLKKVSMLADQVVVMDQLSCQTLLANGITNVTLLPNPLSDNIVKVINSITTTRNPRTLLFAGHCIPTKGVTELVTACKSISGIKLLMVGAISPEMESHLKSLSGDDNSWLEIKGQVSHKETIAYMKSCDIFVLPTYTEGFPNVILESMACGCPIIASGVGAIPEMLEEENGKCYGVVIEPRNTQQLKSAIEMLLRDSDLKHECGSNAKVRVIERYSIEKVCKQLNEIWKQTKEC